MKQQCQLLKSGHVTVLDYPAISRSELPIFQVRWDSGDEGFILAKDFMSLRTEQEQKKLAAEAAECRRRGGVNIGMSKAQVLASCWGKPQRVNTTYTAGLQHEQWVYGNNYVYLRDGVVTSIQTSR